jgi:hypothetical protein
MPGWVQCTRIDGRLVWINLNAATEIEVLDEITTVIFARGDDVSVVHVREPPDKLLAARRQ